MAKVSSSAMWSATGMANVQASAIPAYLKDKGLYDGSAFINDPDACSIYQEAPFQNTNLCSQGLLFLDFAKALCRAMGVSPRKVSDTDAVFPYILVPRRDGKCRYHGRRIFRQQNR